MRILVAYGSKRGGTAGLAEQLADALRAVGHAVEVRPAPAPPPLGWTPPAQEPGLPASRP